MAGLTDVRALPLGLRLGFLDCPTYRLKSGRGVEHMCVAIPYGRPDRDAGTRVGRWLRARPARITRIVGGAALALGLVLAVGAWSGGLMSNGPTWFWRLLLVSQGIGALVFAGLLERLPRHCRVSALGYPGHWLQALVLLTGVLLTAGGAAGPAIWVTAPGVVLLLLAWHLAAGPLRRQISWCRVTPSPTLRRLPLALNGGFVGLVLLALGAYLGLNGLGLTGAALLVGSVTLLALGIRQTAPVSGGA